MKTALLTFSFLLTCSIILAQEKILVRGTVTDETNSPVSNANIIEKGTNNGVISGNDGKFQISVSKNARLQISYSGYGTQEVAVGANPTVSVSLQPGQSELDRVVVIGYGTQRERNILSAVSTVDLTKLEDVPGTNVSRLLTGQAAGVVATQTSGKPGQEFDVRIRGTSSIGAGNEPIYVIDGFVMGTSIGQNLNPNDIQSITVLKDAASAAIYGARGSNGVVLITTKSAGRNQKQINFTASYGIANIPKSRKPEMMNAVEFGQFKKEMFLDRIRFFEQREPSEDEVPEGYRFPEQATTYTNWFDEVLTKNAPTQDYNITMQNGNGAVRSFLSLGYFDQKGSLIATDFKRYSVRTKIEADFNKFIKVGWNLNGSFSNQRVSENPSIFSGTNTLWIFSEAARADPRQPIYNEDGSYKSVIGGTDGVARVNNAVQKLYETDARRHIVNVNTQGYGEITFLKNFSFRSSVSVGINDVRFKQFNPSSIYDPNTSLPSVASLEETSARVYNIGTDQLLNYSKSISNHTFDVMAGYTYQTEILRQNGGTGRGFANDLIRFLSAAQLQNTTSSESQWSLLAYFGRLNYAFYDKYLLSATFRREGSSRFGENNKWGNFPSVSAGWRISEEKFMPQIDWLNDLKLRASWGVTGNNNIGNYASAAPMAANNYVYGGQFTNGFVANAFSNPNLGWEKSDQVNVGLDFSLLNDKVQFSAEYYRKITTDMLLPMTIPLTSGFASVLSNVGKVENKGFEFTVNGRTTAGQFRLSTNFNIAFNRNMVIEMRSENDQIWGPNAFMRWNMIRPGLPINVFWGHKILGIFQNQEEIDKNPNGGVANIPGTYQYWDANGDGQIVLDGTDMTQIGNPHPDFTWGWNIGVDYKRFDLAISITGMQGYDTYREYESILTSATGSHNPLKAFKDRWRSEADPGSGKYPTTNTTQFVNDRSDRFVYDASHAWLRNVSLGYTIPDFFDNSLRIYFNAENLFILSGYPDGNPQVQLGFGNALTGVDTGNYPTPTILSIGARLTL